MKKHVKIQVVTGALAVVAGAVLFGFVGLGSCETRQGFTFAVLGDRTGRAVEGIYEQVLEDVSFLSPDLIITVGDHIQGYNVDSLEVEGEWDHVVGLLDGTGLEYHLTSGNHDIWDEQSKRIYERRFGSPDTAFDYGGTLFITLDVSTLYSADAMPPEQREWLEGALGRSGDFSSVFVFFHKPFWCEDLSFERPNQLHDLFRQYGVKAVFTGHYHRHFYAEWDGIRYFGVSSSGGGVPPGGRAKGCFYSYLMAKVAGESLSVRLVEPGFGMPVDVITVDDAIRIAEIEKSSIAMDEILVDGVTLAEAGRVTVKIENPAETTLRDTATWILRDGWTIEPLRDYVEVPPGEVGTLTAFADHEGQLFPVPSLKLNVPVGDTFVEVMEPLKVKRVMTAAYSDSDVVIDGWLEGAGWQGTHEVGRFFLWGADASADSTALRVCRDSVNLYFGIECMESRMDEISAGAEQRDGSLRHDDNVSILLEPHPGSQKFYQIVINPLGTVFDQRIEICPFGTWVLHPDWDSPLEVVARMLEDRWILEMSVPLAAFDAGSDSGSKWGLNFSRWQSRPRVGSAFQIPYRYDTDTLGYLIFE